MSNGKDQGNRPPNAGPNDRKIKEPKRPPAVGFAEQIEAARNLNDLKPVLVEIVKTLGL